MSELLDDHLEGKSVSIDSPTRTALLEASKWAKFLAIVGFVMVGLATVIGVGGLLFTGVSGLDGGAMLSIGMAVAYLIMIAIYFFPLLYMFRFSKQIRIGVENDNQDAVNSAFVNLKSYFKFLGILILILLILYALMFVLGVGGGLLGIMGGI